MNKANADVNKDGRINTADLFALRKIILRNFQIIFIGYRFALFNYATKAAGGFVDFDYFRISGVDS
nr:dockerin type I domain-containing protein [Clostridium puniceum]